MKATPRLYLRGANDLSGGTPTIEAEELPQHLPHLYTFAEQGDTLPQVAIGTGRDTHYGKASFDTRSRFATHQTPFINTINAAGNQAMIQRLKTPNGKTALLRLSVEVIPAEIPLYERNPDGTFKVNSDGDYIQEMDGLNPAFAIGQRLVLHTSVAGYPTNNRAFKQGVVVSNYRLGNVVANSEQLSTLVTNTSDPVSSTLYPLVDLEVSTFGEHGNRKAVRLDAPNTASVLTGNASLMANLKTYLYRFTCLSRPETSVTPNIVETQRGALYMDLAFKNDVYDPISGVEMSFADAFIPAYQDLTTDIPTYGPFGRVHVYNDNFDTLLDLLCVGGEEVNLTHTTVGEGSYDTTATPFGRTAAVQFTNKPENYHLLNFLSGKDQNNVPYFTFDVSKSVQFGGVAIGPNSVLYADGGDDGLIKDIYGRPNYLANMSLFDELVKNELDNYGDLEAKMLNLAKYPCSTHWDSGFSHETKRSMLRPMSLRKNMWCALSTQALGDYTGTPIAGVGAKPVGYTGYTRVIVNSIQLDNGTYITLSTGDISNTPAGRYKVEVNNTDYTLIPWAAQELNTSSQDYTYGSALRAAASNYPESEYFSTPVCRAVIVKGAGRLHDTTWKHNTPLTLEVARMVAEYAGAGNRRWKAGKAFDIKPNNQMKLFQSTNVIWQKDSAYDADWDAGLIWPQDYDRKRMFFPAFQTVYNDDTSTLNTLVNMMALADLNTVAFMVWRDMLNGGQLTKDQFIERSNQAVDGYIKDAYDGRIIIVPRTYYTPEDEENGFSWHLELHHYADVGDTVGTTSIITHRLSDLVAA